VHTPKRGGAEEKNSKVSFGEKREHHDTRQPVLKPKGVRKKKVIKKGEEGGKKRIVHNAGWGGM